MKYSQSVSLCTQSDQDGATAIEYGLIAAAIAVVIITAVISLGGNISSVFTAISNAI